MIMWRGVKLLKCDIMIVRGGSVIKFFDVSLIRFYTKTVLNKIIIEILKIITQI